MYINLNCQVFKQDEENENENQNVVDVVQEEGTSDLEHYENVLGF